MAVSGMNESEEEVSQTLDLKKLTGKDLSSNESLMNEIGQAVIDYTLKRASETLGQGRKALHSPYSEEYADSLDFKAAGKSKGKVNMKLSGDMLSTVDLLSVDSSKIKIGINDPDQAPKAYGHQSGFAGHPTIKGVPARKFLGITNQEFKEFILPKFKDYLQDIEPEKPAFSISKAINLIKSAKDLFTNEN
jgi:phage gpG-like protein